MVLSFLARRVLWQQNPVFGLLPAETLDEVISRYPEQCVAAQATILEGGEPEDRLHVLLSGTVRIYHRSADGREAVVKLLRAPALFAEFEIFTGLSMLESVDAIDEVQLACIPKAQYFALLMDHPEAMFAHLKHLASAFAVAARSERQVFTRLEQRIANLLLTHAAIDDAADGPVELPTRLPQHEITRSLGAVHRSVARVIGAWKKKGWVEQLQDERWALLKPQELESLAAPIRHSLDYQMGMSLTRLDDRAGLARAQLRVLRGHPRWIGRVYSVNEEAILGCQAPATILLPGDFISNQHCRVFRASTGGRFWIEDLDSLNGCELNGRPVKRAVLENGDEIAAGGFTLKVVLQDP